MSLQFRVMAADGSEKGVLDGVTSEEEYEFDKIDIAKLYVLREDVNAIELVEDEDEIALEYNGETLFAGILRDVTRGGGTTELLVESYERLALDAEPTPGGETWDGAADTTIIQDALDSVPELTAGTIENLDSDLTFVFSHTSPAKKIRTVADATGADVVYNPDKTVDIVADSGTDKTNTTLSPDNQRVTGDFSPERKAGDDRVTHLRMLGAGEGDAQVEAEAVATSWSEGDRKKWGTRTNKDYSDAATLGKLAQTIVDELASEWIEVETTVRGVTVGLADRFHIVHTEEEVDHDLTAVDVTRVIDSNGVTYETVFSSRVEARETREEKDIRDVDRYNMAFEGSPVTINTGGGRQPVNNSYNYEFDVYYPDEVVHEHRVKLQIKGMAYRAYSQGAASAGGSHSHSVSIGDHDHSVDIPGHTHDVDLPSHSHGYVLNGDHVHDVPILGDTTIDSANGGDGHYHTVDFTMSANANPGDETQETTDSGGGSVVTSQSGGGTTETTSNGGGTTTTSSDETPKHTHEPEPGIIESFGGTTHFPSNCDVLINGNAIDVSLGDGSGAFEATVDIAGELIAGEWNTIEISSDSLGHLMAHLDVDVYRQILGRG